MNLIRKGHGHKHRGVIGIESAIVLIAFVIVAAALAFVVLNMGFATSQKAKTSIVATLGEAGSSLQVSGKVFAWADTAAGEIEIIGIPIKLASGGESVNLNQTFTAVKYVSDTVTYDDVYEGTTISGVEESLATASITASTGPESYCTSDPILGADPTSTCAYIYFTVDLNGNDILDPGEHAVLAIAFRSADSPTPLDKVKLELIPPSGATMTVERQIPNISTSYVDLG
jgi:flagellin FlaB